MPGYMVNEAFAPKSIFQNIFKYMMFQRRQKALLWSKGLRLVLLQLFGLVADQYKELRCKMIYLRNRSAPAVNC